MILKGCLLEILTWTAHVSHLLISIVYESLFLLFCVLMSIYVSLSNIYLKLTFYFKNSSYWSTTNDILRCTRVVSLVVLTDVFNCVTHFCSIIYNWYFLTPVEPSYWCWWWIATNITTKFLCSTFVYVFRKVMYDWNLWFVY